MKSKEVISNTSTVPKKSNLQSQGFPSRAAAELAVESEKLGILQLKKQGKRSRPGEEKINNLLHG